MSEFKDLVDKNGNENDVYNPFKLQQDSEQAVSNTEPEYPDVSITSVFEKGNILKKYVIGIHDKDVVD